MIIVLKKPCLRELSPLETVYFKRTQKCIGRYNALSIHPDAKASKQTMLLKKAGQARLVFDKLAKF